MSDFKGIRRFAEGAHLASLGLWVGVIAGTGLAAAALFPAVKALDPSSPAYAAYEGEQWLLIAGAAGERIFAYTDAAQFVLACSSLLTLIIALLASGPDWKTPATALRVPLVCASIGILAYSLFMHTPEMNEHLRLLRQAAEAGDTQAADTHQAAFRAMHPTASNLLGSTALCAMGAFIAGYLSATQRGGDTTSDDIETPALARSGL